MKKRYWTFLALSFAILMFGVSCKTKIDSSLGKQAFQWTSEMVSFGPRVSGSVEVEKVRGWVLEKVKNLGFVLEGRDFVAKTPKGFLKMKNLSYVISGKNHDEKIILLAHYDSKYFPDRRFVGANDAASSVALLLALSSKIQKIKLPFDVQIVFVDGEEAFVNWSFEDSLYGSRQLAQDIRGEKIKAVIVVDMVGDKDLTLIRSRGSDEKLLSVMEMSLKEMKQLDKLDQQWSSVEDDHTPFLEMGIPALHLMDFTFGGSETPGTFWHTENDSMENISAESLSITGELILRILQKI